MEIKFKTNPYIIDTDKDGLNDGIEVNVLATNPLAQDSDGDGTLDGDEDADSDRLTNLEANHIWHQMRKFRFDLIIQFCKKQCFFPIQPKVLGENPTSRAYKSRGKPLASYHSFSNIPRKAGQHLSLIHI